MKEWLKQTQEKVQGMREPFTAGSVEEFMNLVDTREGSMVELFPGYRKEGEYYQRPRREDEEVYFNNPPWVTEFHHTGSTFVTHWQSRMPSNRRVTLTQEHETLDKKAGNRRSSFEQPSDFERAKERWFNDALLTAAAQHQQFPHMKFMVHGVDGLQDYSYYTDKQSDK